MDYSAVVPVYNEAENLHYLYERLSRVLYSLNGEAEIIMVNDGSTDSSEEILKEIAQKDKRFTFINFKRNFGQHPAVVAGLLKAEGKYIITLDADLQNPPEEIPRMITEIDKGYDEVSGKRKKRKDTLFRKIPSFFVNLIISLITRVWLEDYGSMLRVFKKDTAKKLAELFLRKQSYITMLIPKVSRNIKEIEVSHGERVCGESKYDTAKLLDAFLRIFFAKKTDRNEDVNKIFEIDYIVEAGVRKQPAKL